MSSDKGWLKNSVNGLIGRQRTANEDPMSIDIPLDPYVSPPDPPRRKPQRRLSPPPWGADVIGRPVHRFEPVPPSGASYRPDFLADGWSTDRFTVRLASIRGYSHRHAGRPRQDDAAVVLHEPTETVVFAVSDGVSAAEFSHIGATAACRAAVSSIVEALNDPAGAVDWNDVVRRCAWQLAEQARSLFHLPAPDPARAEEALACTLVAGMVQPTSDGDLLSLIQVGDSSAWLLRHDGYRRLLDTKNRAGQVISSNEVTALPRTPQVVPCEEFLAPTDVLLVGTDGFGDPLGDGSGEVGRYFGQKLSVPPPPLELARCLDFSRDTFDDDRTLLALWTRPASSC
ncbi:protein phosphatase 2C domain-containing protein [Micromonospora endophytica]|uniref:PPM-type phosphatase domain-containing protein n=1 Tax=Micromonospora endophytica TaxID=515350 RepID=A0A2W2DXB0_9ACTN|nr:protein phosphatase 2C domain-containing protein [Micromonospora endophytica]PZF97503.1 hypothetical protein C1I93_11620 [Micromonospora endophytica]RIW45705.1 hypothetical protein D3H59_14835 [Micromonospora endophytica]BCJ62790.1 hypothetical protein Jiend_62120 [Micromonospora endophytica]